jgi:hypothetical protein
MHFTTKLVISVQFLTSIIDFKLSISYRIYALSKNCEKRLLASSCLSARPSVRSPGKTQLPLDRFSLNLIFEYFSKKYQEIQVWLKSDKNSGHFI